MERLSRAHIVMAVVAGVVLATAGMVGAIAGLGFTAFWIVAIIGAPLSLIAMHFVCRRLGIPTLIDPMPREWDE
jgi:membrane protein DedA with SNARE-associated domain